MTQQHFHSTQHAHHRSNSNASIPSSSPTNPSSEILHRLQTAVHHHQPANIRDFMMRYLWLEEYGNRWLHGESVPLGLGIGSSMPTSIAPAQQIGWAGGTHGQQSPFVGSASDIAGMGHSHHHHHAQSSSDHHGSASASAHMHQKSSISSGARRKSKKSLSKGHGQLAGNAAMGSNNGTTTTGPNMKRRHTFEVHTDSDLHSKLLTYKMSSPASVNGAATLGSGDDGGTPTMQIGRQGGSNRHRQAEHQYPRDDQDEDYDDDDYDNGTHTPVDEEDMVGNNVVDDPSAVFSFLKRQSSSTSVGSRYDSDDDFVSTPHSFNMSRRAFSFSVHPNSKRNYVDIDSNESDAIRRRYSISHDRRRGISSEIIDMAALSKHKPPVHPKSDDERSRLASSTQNNVLFKYLEEDDKQTIYDAMFEKKYKAGETIITQGADGDNFYVVDSGECEIFQKGDDGEEKLIKTTVAGDSFGELALIYGQPRAATVRSKTDVKCWAIDRLTFRKIMMGTTLKKRRLYEEFLKKVTILENLTPYERMTVSDALVPCEYKDGEVIIKEGGQAYSFYIITEGEVKVTKRIEGEVREVARLQKSNYFGELALLFEQPRAATVIAVGNVKCIKMDRKSFNNLLGPCMSILKRNLDRYNSIMAQQI
mmetsp:Transcript_5969/g.22654  ORF Transcript_5969/g.22654 Transcript_5969/m.22654 type:complete len:647 (-) Transcript_5969:68-2008(-)|eukprot:CAMPEP_0117449674 /NCGR_PEP_ID=MMETSP0759-20121206/8066_1 /TAXON_ID=63605 /ORGANISM="Percolomonas cosmopolitus, Strain WS" /LENGTH=646 /DNA_ID=CAMNT_0005242155 /DNA_START=250 /DNA_END=2190 /DNA_ORIENTATION=-